MPKLPCGILLGLAFALLGCASAAPGQPRLARLEGTVVCKHCNCFMPANVAPDAICPACDCGYPAAECTR